MNFEIHTSRTQYIEPPSSVSYNYYVGQINYVHSLLNKKIENDWTVVKSNYLVDKWFREQINTQKNFFTLDNLRNKIENIIAQRLSEINEIEYVFLSLKNNLIDIWTVINSLDRNVREKIYNIEYDILKTFKEFQFDFHVICRDNRNIEEVYPSNTKMVYNKLVKTDAQ